MFSDGTVQLKVLMTIISWFFELNVKSTTELLQGSRYI